MESKNTDITKNNDQDENAEINQLRSVNYSTLRPTVTELEDILYKPIPVLDHGFIRVVDYMGNDSAIVQAARVSYGRGTKKSNEDKGLINYLMRHSHTTPFEMCEIKFHIKLPIFVARQWIRHRTANVNEYSARYSILDREFYLPLPENLAAQSKSNNQGREDINLSTEEAELTLKILKDDAERCYDNYIAMLNIDESTGEAIDENRKGLARELARMNLPLNYYTQWYWKIDLHNLLRFLRLRADSHAQFEIRAYAEVMLDIVSKWVPATHEAFVNHQLDAVTLSKKSIEVIRAMLSGEKIEEQNSGLSKREWNELMKQFPNS